MLTLSEIKDAYNKTGLIPKRCITIHKNECCPFAALYISNNGYIQDPCLILDWAKKKYGNQEVFGFINGFDNYDTTSSSSKEYLDAREFGKEVAQYLLEKNA